MGKKNEEFVVIDSLGIKHAVHRAENKTTFGRTCCNRRYAELAADPHNEAYCKNDDKILAVVGISQTDQADCIRCLIDVEVEFVDY